MSTYLVAFVVGPFEATEPVDVNGAPLRIVVPKGKAHLAGFALECSRFCLDYLASYYGIPYPGGKVDMVAVPDFAFGAMENLGCITYRESLLLVDEATATSAEKMRVLDVIGHELAHMWFGDLVTMKWWNGIWLNEAFATFMEMKATDAYRPEWKRWLEFAAVERPWALKVDDLAGTRPVEYEVRSPEDAEGMFDALTYGKGSAVLRMMEQYIGEEPFRRGVGSYLRAHAYANTETRDLWQSLDRASGRPVGGDHGHLDTAGRLSAADGAGGGGGRLPGAAPLHDHPRPRRPDLLGAAGPAPGAAGGDDWQPKCCWTARRRLFRHPDPSIGWPPTRAATVSTGVCTKGRFSRRWWIGSTGWTPWSGSLWWTTPGPSWSRGRPERPPSSGWRPLSPARRSRRCGERCWAGRAASGIIWSPTRSAPGSRNGWPAW